MPLDFQKLPVSFAQGLDTKTDRKQVIPGRLLELENGVFRNAGAISKRYGYDTLSRSVDGGDSLSSGSGLSTYRDELLQFSGSRVFSRVAATEKWVDRGQAVSVITGARNVIANGYQQLNPDLACNAGLEVYAWEDSREGVRYSVVDADTGAFLVSDAVVSSDGYSPKAIALSSYVLIVYVDGTTLRYRAINVGQPARLGSEVIITSSLNSTHALFDLCANGPNRVYLCFADDAAGTSLLYIDSSLTLSSATATGGAPIDCLTTWPDASQNVWVSYHDGSAVKGYVRSYTLASVLSPTTIESNSATVNTITGIATGDGYSTLFYEFNGATPSDGYVKSASFDTLGDVFNPTVFKRSVGLGSKAFRYGDSVYVNLAHESTLQSTYFTVDGDGNIIAKISPNVGGGLRTNSTLPQVDSPSTGIYKFAACKKGRILSELNTIFSLLGVFGASLDFAHANQFLTTELGQNLYVIGGVVQSYDGVSFTEHGFHLYPEDLQLVGSASGGFLGDGSFQYIVTYEWTDNNGRIQRSTTSPIATIELATGGSTNSVQLTIPTLRLTAKTGDRDEVRICVYRTQADRDTFYRVTSVVAPTFNDPSVDSITFVDALDDDSIVSNERVYTDGGVLDADAPPASRLITTYKNRVWLAGLEDPQSLWFSQTLIEGEPVGFSEFLTVKCDQRGGAVSALLGMDDKLIVFKETAVFALAGEGPTNTGDGQTYDAPVLITSDVGTVDPNSVALTPNGIVFQSAKGIMLLDSGLSLSYLGAPVETFNGLRIASTAVLPDQNLTIFTTADDRSLVFDYFFQQWSTFTNHTAVDSLIWNGTYCYLKSNGTVYRQNKEKFTDGSTLIRLKLKTSFLTPAGLQGFMRIKRIAVLGEFKGTHQLVMRLHYDFNDAFTAQYVLDPSPLFGANTWGSSATWGSDSVFGGSYTPYHFIAHLQRQLCQAISVSLEDSQSSSYNEGYSISAITLEAGIKNGLNKTPAINKAG